MQHPPGVKILLASPVAVVVLAGCVSSAWSFRSLSTRPRASSWSWRAGCWNRVCSNPRRWSWRRPSTPWTPPLFIAHLVQQAHGHPQALADLLADSAKERVVNPQRIREMKHAAGVQYLDFTPVMIVALASVVGARYLAIGAGDTERYLFAGMLAAAVISIRVFLFRGGGKGE
jgi:hypothetical protein